MQQSRGQRKTTVGNITNIINNNNINNFIINDPSKTPPQFHMAHASHNMGIPETRVGTAPIDSNSSEFNGMRNGLKQFNVAGSGGVYVPTTRV
jgi:hypothetical protein